jgi:hypothetical protein
MSDKFSRKVTLWLGDDDSRAISDFQARVKADSSVHVSEAEVVRSLLRLGVAACPLLAVGEKAKKKGQK